MAEKARCAVAGCTRLACVEVILYDLYPVEQHMFFERDFTFPYLCARHLAENEAGAQGVREPRGRMRYPFTNRDWAQGFSIYRPLKGGLSREEMGDR
jgi:hypothetical protein